MNNLSATYSVFQGVRADTLLMTRLSKQYLSFKAVLPPTPHVTRYCYFISKSDEDHAKMHGLTLV